MGSQPGEVLMRESVSPLHLTYKILHIIAQLFILLGFIKLISPRFKANNKKINFSDEYVAISIINFLLFIICFIIPWIHMINIYRLYHIVLFLLAPFCVIGGLFAFEALSKIFKIDPTHRIKRNSFQLLSIFFAIFLLFSTGWIYEVARDNPASIALSQESIKEYGDANAKNFFYAECCPEQDIFGIMWISKNRKNGTTIYADLSHKMLPFTSYGMMPDERVLTNTSDIRADFYIYLGYLNVHYGLMNGPKLFNEYWNLIDVSPLFDNMGVIYSSGGNKVLYL